MRCAMCLHCSWSCSTVRSSRTSQPRRKRIDMYLRRPRRRKPGVAEAQPGSWEARTWPLCRESLTAWAPTVSSSCRSSSSSSYSVWCACWAQPFATSAPGLGSTVCHICAGTGLTPATSAPRPVSQVRNASVSGELSVLLPCCCLLRLQNPFVKVCSAPCVCAEYPFVPSVPVRREPPARPSHTHSLARSSHARTSALRAARALQEAGRAALLYSTPSPLTKISPQAPPYRPARRPSRGSSSCSSVRRLTASGGPPYPRTERPSLPSLGAFRPTGARAVGSTSVPKEGVGGTRTVPSCVERCWRTVQLQHRRRLRHRLHFMR